MGFGVSGLINKYLRPALIRYNGSGTDYFLEGWKDENSIVPDVKKSETHSYQSNVTQMALEDGSIVSEHIIQQPISVSIQFEETNNTTRGCEGEVFCRDFTNTSPFVSSKNQADFDVMTSY